MSEHAVNGEALTDLESSVIDSISVEEPWALLEEFSDLERVSGTADERRAADYITDQLDGFGVSYERHEPELYISQPHSAEITVEDRSFDPGPVKTVSFSASTTVSGPVEYVGAAGGDLLEDDDDPQEPYHDVGDLTGTVALTAAGSLSIRAASILADKGAIGVIAIHEHDSEPHNGIATSIWGGAPRYENRDEIPSVPIINVNNPDGQQLKTWAESADQVQLEMSTDLTTDWMECPVVVADIEANADTDEFVLLHGHYDSWFVGVTDNATGDAGLLESARVFDAVADQLDRNLRIAWWPGHSTGRYAGSTWYAQEYALDIADNCVAQVNMDSPGAKDTTEYADMSCWCPEAHELVGGAIDDVTAAPYEEHFPYRAGDYSFDNLGVTGLFMLSSNIPAEERDRRGYHGVGGCGGNSDAWHVSTDTMDKAGKDELVRDIRVYAVTLLRVLNADLLPFDHARSTRVIAESVREYDETAGEDFDFTLTLNHLERLESELTQFQRAARDGDIDQKSANECITELSRILTRLNLVQDGQFEQDPAVGRDPVPRLAPAKKLPILDGSELRFMQVQLKREQNTVVKQLRDALELLPDRD